MQLRDNRYRIILGLTLWVLGNHLFAQDFKRDFKSAKEFFEDKKYNFAMEAFKPLMVYDRMNPYPEYASFYYALSAYHQNFYSVAKESLVQIKKLYPSWDQIDEVDYWLAAVYFQQSEPFQALRMLYGMKSYRDLASIESMKRNFLTKIYDEEVIKLLLEEFPGEAYLLKRLVTRKILKGEYTAARELVALNGLDTLEFPIPKMKPVLKDKYRVAALFPFLAEALDPSPGSKLNQATLDLYQGMKFATDSLRASGVNIELVGYDTERLVEKVGRILALEEMKSADVLVGPLFSEEVPPVIEFAKKHNVLMVNPISNNGEYIKDNPNGLLLQPDYETLGRASAEALAKRNLKRPCVVIYGETTRDTTMAFAFLKRAKELNIKISLEQQIARENTSDIYSILVNATKYDKFKNPVEFTLKKDSIGSVFVASEDELIFTKVISSIDRRADSVIIVGQHSWIDKPSMDFDKFERLHIMMAAPGFTQVFSPEFQTFRTRYARVFGVMPSAYSEIGFECMMVVGMGLKEHGSALISGLQQVPEIQGVLGRKYRYADRQSNSVVPFIIFENGDLRLLDGQ
jgi:ABC-type branched-subunit amino acid transport system substrate-binding protein